MIFNNQNFVYIFAREFDRYEPGRKIKFKVYIFSSYRVVVATRKSSMVYNMKAPCSIQNIEN